MQAASLRSSRTMPALRPSNVDGPEASRAKRAGFLVNRPLRIDTFSLHASTLIVLPHHASACLSDNFTFSPRERANRGGYRNAPCDWTSGFELGRSCGSYFFEFASG